MPGAGGVSGRGMLKSGIDRRITFTFTILQAFTLYKAVQLKGTVLSILNNTLKI